MFTFLLVLLIIDALLLSTVVLLQAGQGGGLASLGGTGSTDTFVGGRQAVTLLTRASWWCGGIFLALSLMLSLVGRRAAGSSIQERLRSTAAPTAPTAPAAPLPLNATPARDSAAPSGAASAIPKTAAPAASAKPLPTSRPPKTDRAK